MNHIQYMDPVRLAEIAEARPSYDEWEHMSDYERWGDYGYSAEPFGSEPIRDDDETRLRNRHQRKRRE